MKKIIWVGLAIVVIVLVYFGINRDSVKPEIPVVEESEPETLVLEGNAVLMADQQPDKDKFTVQYAKLSKPGYVVVYSTDSKGVLGEILGTSDYLPAGEYKNVVVRRSGGGAVVTREQVKARVVVDNGDRVFNEEEDVPVMTDDGEVVESEALIDEDAEEVNEEDIPGLLSEEGYTLSEDEMTENDDMMIEGDEPIMENGSSTTDDAGSAMEEEAGI